MRSLDTRNGEFSSQENTAGTSLALSQIRRFTVEYPSSTSFFKLSTMAGSRSIKGLRARLDALGVPHGRSQSGAALRIAIEEATKVEVEDQTPDVKDMKVAKPKA